MKKIAGAGILIATMVLSANEVPKKVLKQEIKTKVLQQNQGKAKVQDIAALKPEVKIKSQNYPRGNIATH